MENSQQLSSQLTTPNSHTVYSKQTAVDIANAYINCINSPATTEWSDNCDSAYIKSINSKHFSIK